MTVPATIKLKAYIRIHLRWSASACHLRDITMRPKLGVLLLGISALSPAPDSVALRPDLDLRHSSQAPIAMIRMPATVAPTPMPAFAAVESPLAVVVAVAGAEDVCAALCVLEIELLDVDDAILATTRGAEAGVNDCKSVDAQATATVCANAVKGYVYCEV